MIANSIVKQSGSIPSTEGLPICYDLYIPSVSVPETFNVILFIHGFKGFKDWGPFPDACEDLARAGFAVVAFNMSHSGLGASGTDTTRPDLFRSMTLSQDVRDIGSVIAAIRSGDITTDRIVMNPEKIGLVGHSRGGHNAIVATAEFPEVKCLVSWSAVADFMEYWNAQMVKDWEEKGFTEVVNSRTGEVLRLGREGYDDLQEHAARITALRRVREVRVPSLFIVGKKDESVPVGHSERLYMACPSDVKEIRLIPGAGHTFDASHPFALSDYPTRFAEVLEFTEDWFVENLR